MRARKDSRPLFWRTTKTVENYVDGVVSDVDDKTVELTYDPSGNRSTLKALLTGGGYQETRWVYGITSPFVSNDVLKEVRYPDPSTGSASATEKDGYTYDLFGDVLTVTDRNGTVHTYTRDLLGRVTADAVTTLGSGVDGSVRRIETAYDGQGNAYLVTGYDAASAGTVVNQVQRAFNGLGQLTQEWQAVSGTVNPATTPSVQYGYSFAPSGGTNHSRLTSITYPNGRALGYNYAAGLADTISRLSAITDGVTTLENYEYLGLSTVVKRGHPQPGVDLTYVKLTGESNGEAGNQYAGLDRFGRVTDQRWTTTGGTAKDRWQYRYDRDSNRLYKENLLDSTRSELYAYDGLNQITSFARGTLNGTKDAVAGTPSRSQGWQFDALGNFNTQTTDGAAQTRTHNRQNEITSISGATTPTYDANGNLTKDEAGRTFKYDAWNRLVEVRDSGNILLATYRYDGLNRRLREIRGATTTDLYYSAAWQVLEERVGSAAQAQYVWSPVYLDALICRDRDTDGNGSLDERLYAIQDDSFNVTGLLDTSGNVLERYGYDAFGIFMVLTPAWGTRTSSLYGWAYQHQGLRWDAATGSYHDRGREYTPTLARFLQLDPMQFAAGDVDFYRYEGNGPVGRLDPLGLQWPSASPPAQPNIPPGGSGFAPPAYPGVGFPKPIDRPGGPFGSIPGQPPPLPPPPSWYSRPYIPWPVEPEDRPCPAMCADHRSPEEIRKSYRICELESLLANGKFTTEAEHVGLKTEYFMLREDYAGLMSIGADCLQRVFAGYASRPSCIGPALARPRCNYLTAAEFDSLPKTGTIDPRKVRFAQDNMGPFFKDGGTVGGIAWDLSEGTLKPSAVKPIRIVLDDDGQVYTLDNRRLKAFELAGVPIQYQKLNCVPWKDIRKFTTPNNGEDIMIRPPRR